MVLGLQEGIVVMAVVYNPDPHRRTQLLTIRTSTPYVEVSLRLQIEIFASFLLCSFVTSSLAVFLLFVFLFLISPFFLPSWFTGSSTFQLTFPHLHTSIFITHFPLYIPSTFPSIPVFFSSLSYLLNFSTFPSLRLWDHRIARHHARLTQCSCAGERWHPLFMTWPSWLTCQDCPSLHTVCMLWPQRSCRNSEYYYLNDLENFTANSYANFFLF